MRNGTDGNAQKGGEALEYRAIGPLNPLKRVYLNEINTFERSIKAQNARFDFVLGCTVGKSKCTPRQEGP